MEGLKKAVFSLKTIVELAKSIFKIIVIGYFPYRTISGSIILFATMPRMELEVIISIIVSLIARIVFQVCLVLLILAIFDFTYQKWEHEKNLMMSKYDIKQERREMEGDPRVKVEQRRRARRMMMRAMMESVPKADVVLTNPTHLAVALKYDPDNPRYKAPYIVAKGAGLIAAKIKEIAREHDVPVIENKPLARTLYYSYDIGDEIPPELFNAVSEILAFVYKMKGRAA